jgi:D-alanyl-D-alanine carboxypeptidase
MVVNLTATPSVSAKAFLAFDLLSGEVIISERQTDVLPIASITKLLTAATVLRHSDRDEIVSVLATDVATEGRAGRLSAGDTYSRYELLFPLLLESSNDAAAVLERVTDGEIVSEMNDYAAELGASTLTMTDASGLSAANRASAEDLMRVTRQLFRVAPHVFDITQLNKRVGETVVWLNNSPLLTTDYQGGKHGYTEAAGRTAVALYTETFGSEERIIGYVVLGSDNLSRDVRLLRDHIQTHVSFQ